MIYPLRWEIIAYSLPINPQTSKNSWLDNSKILPLTVVN